MSGPLLGALLTSTPFLLTTVYLIPLQVGESAVACPEAQSHQVAGLRFKPRQPDPGASEHSDEAFYWSIILETCSFF